MYEQLSLFDYQTRYLIEYKTYQNEMADDLVDFDIDISYGAVRLKDQHGNLIWSRDEPWPVVTRA